ncbi:MAG TPA: CoA transferase [Frankiaceae bacterium]|nr:CoA transferase [Frankiaceae bacterium]
MTTDGAVTGEPLGPLSWLRVVDLTDLRGALCARILADLGADVVRVERDIADGADTTAHRYRNANKRGVVLDLDHAAGRQRLNGLLEAADVLVDNVGADERQGWGLAPNDVAARHPHLVHVALADFGLRGPRSAWRLEALPALAASGTLHATGFPQLPPCNAPGHLAHDCASVYGAIGAVAAMLDAERGGTPAGQLVDISVQEAALAGTNPWSIALQAYNRLNPLLSPEGKRNAEGAYWVLPAGDGWVRAVIGSPRQWSGFVELMRSPDAFEDDVWSGMMFRLQNADVVRLLAEERLTDRSRAQLFDEALALGTTVGVLQTLREFVDHPQTHARSFFADKGFASLEGLPFASHPVNLSRTPASVREPASTAVDVSFRPRSPLVGAAVGTPGGLLLEGVRVVEFGVAAIAPELCGVLSELGADVIKIESVVHLDVLRAAGASMGSFNRSMTFNAECRGRRSVTLDLTTEKGRELAFQLCAGADVVAENYRGGVLEGLGLGYEAIRAVNPRVVYASSQGYGSTGPFGEMPAYGPLNSGFTGVHLLWNHPDAPYPCGTSLNHPDHIGGKLLAVGVLAALREREASGEGQRLEMAQTEVSAYLIGEMYLDAVRDGNDPAPLGNAHPTAAPHGVYPSEGDDAWVAIAVMNDDDWQRLCKVVGWDSAELPIAASRLAARDQLDERLAGWTRSRSNVEAAELLQAQGVSAMPVMGPVDQHVDPHLAEREFIVHLQHPEVGEETHVGNPIRFSSTTQRTAVSAPNLGADTEAVLTSVLGLSPADVAELIEQGVCR